MSTHGSKKAKGDGPSQLQMDWDRYQREGWIANAAMPDGVANDGTVVRADKLASLLFHLNGHLGDNGEAFPSQDLLAQKMKVSTKTVGRAAEALQNMSLLIVQLKNRPGFKRVINHYRIVWSELLLLDPDRRRAFGESISGGRRESRSDNRPDQSDVGVDQSDVPTDQSDVWTDQSDKASPKLFTNHSKNSPPLTEADRGGVTVPGESPGSWEVVVSALAALGMGGAQKAVDAAQRFGDTPDDVNELMARWERLRARQPSVTVAWLFRWMTRQSQVPPDEEIRQAGKPHRSLTSESTRLELIRGRVLKSGRRAGHSDEQISAALERELDQAGYPKDAIAIAGTDNIFNRWTKAGAL